MPRKFALSPSKTQRPRLDLDNLLERAEKSTIHRGQPRSYVELFFERVSKSAKQPRKMRNQPLRFAGQTNIPAGGKVVNDEVHTVIKSSVV